MSVAKFYSLKVKEISPETADCVSVAFEIPEELKDTFLFSPGQYLTLRHHINNEEVRRSYSICTSPLDNDLRVAVKKVENGKFSTYANDVLKQGDILDVMPPMGKFSPREDGKKAKHYIAFAAGSGITPIMSIMKTVLEEDADSKFTLVYGNKNRNTIIFREAIEALKNKYMQRMIVYHVLSREVMDAAIFNGRIDAGKCVDFCDKLIDISTVSEAFICGPEDMILSVRKKLGELGMPEHNVHIELFTSPEQPKHTHEKWVKTHEHDANSVSKVQITLDGSTFEMDLAYNGDSILDAALKTGADLPYACKGGVCSTCKAQVIEGEVDMEVNYSLEPDELKKGFVLTCQAHPRTERVVVDFDVR